MLYTIGELSAIVKVSRDTLRYYDEIGVLKPEKVDPDNNYRYYNEAQLEKIIQILEYKTYGFTLEEIKHLLTTTDRAEIEAKLITQQKSIITQIKTLTEIVNRINQKTNPRGGYTMNGKRILIVDDVEFMRKVLTEILTNDGHTALTASNGEEALTVYQQEEPDLVLMDIEMPGMNGITCTETIVQQYPNAKIIIVSAHYTEENIIAGKAAGACDFVQKPFQPDILLYCIKRVFNGELEEAMRLRDQLKEQFN